MRENMEQTSTLQEENCSLKPQESYETVCWGCGLRLLLPSYAPVFKCGWCGAITNNMYKKHRQHWVDACTAFQDRLFVPVVLCIILSIICGGVWAVYPVVFSVISLSSVFHSISTFILASGTLVNFCLASFTPAGKPPKILWGNYGVVVKGGLNDYTFCQFCEKPKSAQTHHCRSCKTCVLDMDHHCPFVSLLFYLSNKQVFLNLAYLHTHHILLTCASLLTLIVIPLLKYKKNSKDIKIPNQSRLQCVVIRVSKDKLGLNTILCPLLCLTCH